MYLGQKIRQNSSVYNKYPSNHDFGGQKVLNVGCGFAKFSARNVTNLDAFENCSPDVQWDLTKFPLPFADGTFDKVICNHVLEHIPNWWACFDELARITKVGGMIEVWGPGMGSDGVLGFRDHCNVINQCSFFGTFGYTRPNNAWASEVKDKHAALMKLKNVHANLNKDWWVQKAPKWLQTWMLNHLRNVTYEIGFYFEKIAPPPEKLDLRNDTVESVI